MNRCLILIFTAFNIALALYLWRYFIFLDEVKLLKESVLKSSHPSVFVPTKEWQPIGRDQPIPRNLHVRINMQTGEREARLLKSDSSDESEKNLAIVPVESKDALDGQSFDEKNKYILLRDSLNKISDDVSQTDDQNSRSSQKKFRTYQQLKQDMAELNLNVRTETEVLLELIDEYDKLGTSIKTESQKKNELLAILRDLEDLLHQVDNADEFAKHNGFAKIIVPCLSNNSSDVQTVAAQVLGSAVQNNGKVQIAVLKTGVIGPLLKNIATQKNPEVRSSSTYALSCLVRNFPLAELRMIEEGGLSVLLSVFDEDSVDSFRLQLKTLTFFNDLLIERDDAALTVQENLLLENITDETTKKEFDLMTEKLRQYNNVGLRGKLVERGWCSTLSHFLTDKMFNTLPTKNNEKVNHDAAEKVLNAVSTVLLPCETDFERNQRFNSVIKALRNYYKNLSSDNDAGSFYTGMFTMLDKMCTTLKIK